MVRFIYGISTVYLLINCQVRSCTLFMQVASISPHLPSLGGTDVYWRWQPSDFVLHGPPQSSTVSIVYTSQTKVNVPECGTKAKRPWSASKSDSNDQQSFRHQLQWHLEACNNAEQGRFKIIQNDSASIPRPPKPHIDLARYKSSSGKLSLETLRNFTRCVGCFFCNCTTVVGVGTDTLVQKGTSMQEGKTTVQCRSRILWQDTTAWGAANSAPTGFPGGLNLLQFSRNGWYISMILKLTGLCSKYEKTQHHCVRHTVVFAWLKRGDKCCRDWPKPQWWSWLTD